MRHWQAKLILVVCLAVPVRLLSAQAQERETLLETIQSQVAHTFERSRDAIVRIHAYAEPSQIRRRPDLPLYRIGSGFFIDKRGWVATTASNVDDADKVLIEWKGKKYPAIPLGIDLYTNFALLRMDTGGSGGLPELSLGDSNSLKAGHFVIALGFPYDLDVAFSWGNVSGWDTRRGAAVFPVAHIRSDVKVSPGQGGGPLLNTKGKVVGMVIGVTQQDRATYSLPVNAIKKLRDDFLSSGRALYGWTGVSATDKVLPPDREGFTQQRPVITAVAPNSPAAVAGLKQGDVILKLEGTSVYNSTDIPSITFFKRAGEVMTMQILRGRETKTVELKLAERPAEFIPSHPRTPQPTPTQPSAPPPKVLPAAAPGR